MPSHFTHLLFAEAALRAALGERAEEILRAHGNLFRFGAQGPDFFYHNQRTMPTGLRYGVARVAYVMTTMMEGVINNGTAAVVRGMGFSAPAAGKTGTSHDGWFAGYTSNLLCIVWVGYDDYSDLRLSGSSTAAPIWAEFMKRAIKLPAYHDEEPFQQPAWVVNVQLDKATNRLATAACPETYTVAFIAGTEPKDSCDQPVGEHRGILTRIFGSPAPPPPPVIGATSSTVRPAPPAPVASSNPGKADPPEKKKGIFGKIVGIFKGDKPSSAPPPKDGGTNPH